ncbi:Ig-like domain-containing protein [Flavobacterium caseinilyticum]|uniref:Uncharacterized protein n=1 Tax=Flavobacterium caseinilyticum TaxID=2541732 RepID=A0A4R5AWB7_9FLAO|nr:Ig-like domain-containing protein [Flavobacterium caseinilyticum]TDD77113.1 hypothetical protein E0F89_05810 [Flavobacterium caseinilyticum]
MANIRRTFLSGRMNKDLDERVLKDGDYRHAENILVLDSEGSDVGAIQNSLSNRKLTSIDFGTNPACLGGFSDEATQKLYWIIKSDAGCYVLEYDVKNEVVSKVLEDTRVGTNRVLDLKETHLITAINKIISEDPEKDLILLNDDNLQPLCFNIERAKKYGANGFDKEDILLIKKPPRFAPTTTLVFADGASNNIEEKFLSFSYRYKYLDGEYSALSSYSNYNFHPNPFQLDYEVLDNIGMINAYNAVRLSINTGDKRVTDIQCIVKGSTSENLYIIETFNKENEGWGNNETRSFVFSNNKIYTILPEKELYRSSDGIPLKAKSQTVIGNRIVMGNFVQGYDLIDKNNNKVKPNYNLSIVSESLEGVTVPISITSQVPIANNKLRIDLTGMNLKSGSKINLFFSLDNNQTEQKKYNDNFSFLLTKNYEDAAALAQDPDFIFFITNYITNLFLSNYTIADIPGYEFISNTTFVIESYTANAIILKSVALIYELNNVQETINWGFNSATSVLFYEIGSVSTLKTNRSYEAGLIYMDEFNRQTTVLTQLNNTIFIPQNLALSKNKIKVSLLSNPPAYADRYKIVVKQQTLQFQTIYATTFYVEGLFRWIKLENDNKDKVKVGDILIFKSDTNGFVPTLTKVKVLEIATKEKEFLEGNVDFNNTEIKELPGLYMKIKIPAGISMDYIPDGFLEKTGQAASRGDSFDMYVGPFSDKDPVTGLYTDKPIVQGSRIDIELTNVKYGSAGGDKKFTKTFYASADYANFKLWYDAEVSDNTFPFVYPTNGVVRGVTEVGLFSRFVESETGALYLRIHNELNGNGEDLGIFGSTGHQSYMNGSIKITAANGLIVLETEEKKSIDAEIYYETAQTFEIKNGLHQGNLQNQTTVLPAEIDLDFYNCFCQGNGAESYVIKDAFNKPYLNIDLRPSVVSIEKYKAVRRYADLIYSESYVESSNINGLNVFNVATGNSKELDKQYGSIQKLHSRDNDILVLKESKASKVMFEKGLIYNSDGSSNVSATNQILGPELTYLGDNGIGKNPESFAENDYQIYYANTKQGNIVRLSIDGVTAIVDGMVDWFRDIFRLQPNAKKLGGFDPYTKQYVVSIADEPVKLLQLSCGNQIIKEKQSGTFTYQFKLNDLAGDIILNYNIVSGNATIEALFDGATEVVSNVTGLGNITFNRSSLVKNIVTVTVTAVSASISYEIANVCPIGAELKIASIIVNDAADIGKNITNRFKWGASLLYATDDLFDTAPVSKFLIETGIEGVGKFPLNNSVFTIQSFKDNLASGKFSLENFNRIGYLVSDTVYTEADINIILAQATFLTVTKIMEPGFFETNTASFLFNRTEPDEILYLIWDYTERKPVLVNDNVTLNNAASTTVNVLFNDQITGTPVVTIAAPPVNGLAVVNLDNTITYTHDGTATLTDSIVYQVSNGIASSTATINITVNAAGTLPQPTSSFWYIAIHPSIHPANDHVVYIDEFGSEQIHILTRTETGDNPCEEIIAQSIVSSAGAAICNP